MHPTYRHLFFDLDQTIAPARSPILPEMYNFLEALPHDIVIVSGQETEKIKWQSNELPAFRLGQNGNHATTARGEELWNIPLTEAEREQILTHIERLQTHLPERPNPDWNPIEDRGAQITFSPIGNTAPIDIKRQYDPDATKRKDLLKKVPFAATELVVKIGGSTSFDYIHKDRHKGTNVQRLIDRMGWDVADCIYFGDGLYPGGNDEAVIGVIETVAVQNHIDTYHKLTDLFGKI